MKTEKQKIAQTILLLRILHKDNNISGNLKLQKEVFLSELRLLNQKLGGLYYKYFRYTYGPYSKELAETLKSLADRGFVHKSTYTLTERGTYFIEFVEAMIGDYRQNSKILKVVDSTVKEYERYSGPRLTNIVYELKVIPRDMPGEEVKVKDIPVFCDILVPEESEMAVNFEIPSQVLDDIKTELEIDMESWERMAERNPDSLKRAKQKLLAIAGG